MRVICLFIALLAISILMAQAAETNFQASSLTAKDVNCKKCHPDSPHIIHSKKAVDCVNCHGDKLSVSIPKCTKCHDGPIHQVHAGKVSTQACAYCHKTIAQVHNGLMSDAVCSHCHKDLVEVHGKDASCVKCHKSPPEIVKPVKLEGMILICEDCHRATSVATIHGPVDDKKGCYSCHKGTSKASGSEIPHVIHATKVDCKGCHEENQKVVVPKCTRCHDIDTLHAFNKIGKLTSQSGLRCSVCHPGEAKLSAQQTAAPPQTKETARLEQTVSENASQAQPGAVKTPGFAAVLAISAMFAGFLLRRERL